MSAVFRVDQSHLPTDLDALEVCVQVESRLRKHALRLVVGSKEAELLWNQYVVSCATLPMVLRIFLASSEENREKCFMQIQKLHFGGIWKSFILFSNCTNRGESR